MKRFISIIMILTMLLGMQIASVYADSVKTAFIDFESGVPEIFTRRGGRADLVAGISPDGSNNACQLQWGSTYYINDGNAWVNFDTIYYNADIYTQKGATFVCFSTQRYATNTQFITLSGGNIIAGGETVGSYVDEQWYNVTAVIDRASNMMDVWFDSEQLAYGVPVTFNNADAGMYIAFSTQGSSSSVYMDNITLSNAVPEKPDASALGIVSSVPSNGVENVDVDNAEFKVSFNCALNPGTIDGSVSIDNGAEISDLSYDEGSDSVTFKVSKLTYSTSYAITFSDELTGINGEKFDEDTKFNIIRFSTESEPPPPVTTTIDFESNDVPEVFKRYGGKASIAAGMSADQKGNACYMQYGTMYDINDSVPWVTMDKIYFNADVCAEVGTSFMCFATRRYGGYAAFVTLNNGDIMIGTQKVGSYTPGKWYELTAVIDRSVDKIDVWFDGINVADDVAINFSHNDVTNSFLSFQTDANGGAYIDDITVSNSVANIEQKEIFEIKSSSPENSAENLGIRKIHFRVDFSRILNENTVPGCVSIDNDAVVSNVSYNSEANSIEFDVENLSYDTSYTVTFSGSLTGINGEVLNAFTGGNAVKFTTGKVTVEDIVYTIGNNTAESLLPGEVTPSAKVKNETSQPVSLIYVAALCKGSEDCYEIISSKKGSVSEVAPMGEALISETLSVESTDGYFIKLFVWGSMDDLNPFIIAKAFR